MKLSSFQNIFSQEELLYINQLPQVLENKAKLNLTKKSDIIQFSIPLTESIRSVFLTTFGLNLTNVNRIPLRWILGDSAAHIDRGMSNFENTYLIYLNNNPGELVVDSVSYPINENTGYVFNEGLSHNTNNTGLQPRLMIGPMSEKGFPVGGFPYITYYPSESDALNNNNDLGFNSIDLVVGDVNDGTNGGYTSWRIASNSVGPSPQNVAYSNGTTLTPYMGDTYYFLYPNIVCFLEGTKILCSVNDTETYVPVEHMRPGTLVKTSMNGYKKVELIGKATIQNPGNNERTQNRLYKCSQNKYPELKNDLFITGCHSILVDSVTDKQRQETLKHLDYVYRTDHKSRLMACVDERAEPWNSEGTYTIWHFALENADYYMNYGVYANGLLVESSSKRFMSKLSNLNLIH